MRKSNPDNKRTFACQYCGAAVEEYKSAFLRRKRFNCRAPECISEAKRHVGEANGASGRIWTDEARQKQSELVKSKVDDAYRQRAGSANRGVAFSKERVRKMHEGRSRESYVREHDAATRAKIGRKSATKFTPEYIERVRQVNYSTGLWIDPDNKSDHDVYREEAQWIAGMWDIVAEKELLNEHGVFNPKSNPNGLVRDHILSVRDGLDWGIFPVILRHPANCQLLLNADNSRKRRSSWLTPDELFDNIKSYSGEWMEQSEALEFINRYTSGERWSRQKRRC